MQKRGSYLRKIVFVFIAVIILTFSSYALDRSGLLIGADLLEDAGITGSGQVVCVIDTGIDYTHPNLGGCTETQFLSGNCDKVIAGYDYLDNDNNPMDNFGHGTAIAGIISSDDDKYRGIAPDSKLIAIRVTNKGQETISTFFDNVELGLRWCIDNSTTYNISIISMSLGYNPVSGGLQEECLDYQNLQDDINEAVSKNIFVVDASGNDGFTNGISYPSCLNNITAVGATDYKDRIVSYTNRGNALDLLAPGHNIKTTELGGGFTVESRIVCDLLGPDSNFLAPLLDCTRGTSFASPHVSGAVALLRQFDPALRLGTIERLLFDTGVEASDNEIISRNYKRIDLLAALNVLDWPMFHHDLRRTGFTLLKGDLKSKGEDSQFGFTLDEAIDSSFFDFPSIANVDNDDQQEILTSTSITQGGSSTNFEGRFYVLECKESGSKNDKRCRDFNERWKFVKNDLAIGQAPSIDDLDGDNIKEVVFAGFPNTQANDGTVYAFKANKKGKLDDDDASYVFDLPNETDQNLDEEGEIGHTAIADIDLDGKKEVLLADYTGVKNWRGHLYILEPGSNKQFTLQQNIQLGTSEASGGAKGAIAIANIDSDDYPEIIVPNAIGIHVYGYDGSSVVKQWNNSDAFIYQTAVVADVDADSEYEIVYLTRDDTADPPCSSITCTRKLHIITAVNGSEECTATLTEFPNAEPAVGNLNSDNKLEITLVTRADVGAASGQSYGHIYTYGYGSGTCPQLNSFPATNDIDTFHSAPDIFDIDNDGTNDVIFAATNGTLYVLDNNLDPKWAPYDLGGEIASAPAIGDLDGDGKAEIAAKRIGGSTSSLGRVLDYNSYRSANFSQFALLGTVDNIVTIIEGNNTQPVLDEIDDIYAIENDLINLSVTSADFDLDQLNYSFSSPINESGIWQTDENSSGTYEVLAEVSDGNLTDSQFLTVIVYEEGTILEDNFTDGDSSKELNYTSAGSQTVNVEVNKNREILRAALKVNGASLSSGQNSFQEPTATIIEANELNSTYASNQSNDKDWETYYSAGKATGEIVEIENLNVPSNISHIIFNLKLGIFGGGYGTFAVYNYNSGEYEIVTSRIPSFVEDNRNITFDVYENNPLFVENDSQFHLRVDNLDNYVSSNKTRWYYRYVGDWASQKVYESEVKFEEEIIFPTNLQIDVGNDGTTDLTLEGELHENFIKIDSLNNTNKNETITFNNDSTTRYIKIPKDAIITKAEISVGEKNVETLSVNEIQTLQNEARRLPQEIKGENFISELNSDGTYITSVTANPINYLENGQYLSIDTTIKPSSTQWDYEVTSGIYKAYFKSNPNSIDTVKIEKDNSTVIYQPLNINYKDNLNNVETISNTNQVTAIVSNNEITYPNIFGNGIHLKYIYGNKALKEEFVIDNLPSLPTQNN